MLRIILMFVYKCMNHTYQLYILFNGTDVFEYILIQEGLKPCFITIDSEYYDKMLKFLNSIKKDDNMRHKVFNKLLSLIFDKNQLFIIKGFNSPIILKFNEIPILINIIEDCLKIDYKTCIS